MSNRLAGRVAVVTGGCSGIGLAIAESFIAEGARVVVADILKARGLELQARHSGRLCFALCDVTQENDVACAIGLAADTFGGLDITINNAGALGTTDSIETMQCSHWDHTLNLLLRGALFGIKHSIGLMKARGGGSIVNMSSISGITTSGLPAYCVAKAAVLQLTRLAALELAPYQIRVNSVLPGLIPTAIFGNVLGLAHDQSLQMADILSSSTAHAQPLPRAGKTQDIAEACVYLVSDAASFVTGTELRVDGGMTLMTQMGLHSAEPGSVGKLIAEAARQVQNGD